MNYTFNNGMLRWLLPKKILLIMRLIIIIMVTCFLQVSAASFGQKITLSEKNTPLTEVLKKIRSQSGFKVFYADKALIQAKAVNINIYELSIADALDKVFENQNLSYDLKDKTIIIKRKEDSFADKLKKITGFFQVDSLIFKGRVLDPFGTPLAGATVNIKGSKKVTKTTADGNFVIFAASGAILQVSYVGYETQEIKLRREDANLLRIFNMKVAAQDLTEVNVVSTGYQDLPKERATGSFEVITAKQLQHSTDPNLIKRLEGITTSTDFNNQLQPTMSSNTVKRPVLTYLTIRGRNSLVKPGQGVDLALNSGQVLVVIDGIATPYSVDAVNPNDVESITILKDAAAASIWGSRAANGVIVIKTKKGGFNRPVSISFNSNYNITDKVNLFYKKFMTSSDLIDMQMQRYLRRFGPAYDPDDPSTYLANPNPDDIDNDYLYTPQGKMTLVEEIMNDQRLGEISLTERDAKLNALRNNEVRNDLDKYFLRKAITQSYNLGIDGGSSAYAYRLSAGYDKIQNNTVVSGGNRYTVNYSASVKPLKNLDLQALVGYNQQNTSNQSAGSPIIGNSVNTGFDSYIRLADDNGNPLPVIRGYRPKYLQMLTEKYGNKIQDMTYSPFQEMNEGNFKTKSQGINLNLNAGYKISPVFSANLTYSYNWNMEDQTEYRSANSYYMRELSNIFTTREDYEDPIYGPQPLKKLIPAGGVIYPNNFRTNTQTLRGQLNADKTWNEKHVLSAIAGADVNQFASINKFTQYYGYDPETLSSNNNIPFGATFFRLINDPQSGLSIGQIPYLTGIGDFKTRAISFYTNAAYTYNRRYTLSASLRKDISSAFGQGTNKNGGVFYSLGGSWSINNEKFYNLEWLPALQLRATYGYNGNVNPSVLPYPLINHNEASTTGNLLPYLSINDYVINSLFRPERSGQLNLGLGFGTRNNRLSGSVEYFSKKTIDLISSAPIDPSTGYSGAQYNSANLRSTGIDASLSNININYNKFRWITNFLFSYNRVKLTKLFSPTAYTPSQLVNTTTGNVAGYDLSRMAAYRWAGLDPETGDPMGYINGVGTRITGDAEFVALNASPIASTVRIFGSAVPVYYGNFRNTFSYANFSISANFMYKFGYYTRRPISDIMSYGSVLVDGNLGAGEYADRWQQPGDETRTNVPSFYVPSTSPVFRDEFYRLSEINVIKGDHIRFQEINASYTFKGIGSFLKNPRVYANVSNLGVVWRANKLGIDPEANDYPQPRTYSFGLSANF